MMAKLPIKKMITDALLLALKLPKYVIFSVIWWRFWHVIKMMADVENLLTNDEFFADTADASKQCTEQSRKQDYLRVKK